MSGHTPGPWVQGNTDPLLFGQPQGNGTMPIGFIYGPSLPERSDVGLRALADARLAAAAPDLLDALKGLDEAYCRAGSPLTREERTEDRKRLMAARAAIAKATGATP